MLYRYTLTCGLLGIGYIADFYLLPGLFDEVPHHHQWQCSVHTLPRLSFCLLTLRGYHALQYQANAALRARPGAKNRLSFQRPEVIVYGPGTGSATHQQLLEV